MATMEIGKTTADDERRLELLEEKKQDQEGQDAPFDDLVDRRRDRFLDEPPLLRDEPDPDAGFSVRISSRTALAARVTRTVLAPDAFRTRTPTLSVPSSRARPCRSLTESTIPATSLSLTTPRSGRLEARLADLGHVREFAGDPEGILEPALADGPALEVAVEGVEPPGDVFQAQAVEGNERRVELDPDLPLGPSRDVGGSDALDLLQAGLDDHLAELPEFEEALSPVTARIMMGCPGIEGDDDRVLGLRGDALRPLSSASRAWRRAKSISVPQANSRVRKEKPSLETDRPPGFPGSG